MSVLKKKITWLTPDYFVDCDIRIIPKLLDEFEITWIVILPKKIGRFGRDDFSHLEALPGLNIIYEHTRYRFRDPRSLFFNYKLFKKIKKIGADLVYMNDVPKPFPILMASLLLNRKKTILTAHQGKVHEGFEFNLLNRIIFKFAYSMFRTNHLFSAFQAKLLKSSHPKNKVFLIPLALKSFGTSNFKKSANKVTFLNFGTIRTKKNVDLLIAAACNIFEKGYKNFEVIITGSCNNWSFYQEKIRFPEVFKCDIRVIENNEIPDLFLSTDYLVLPYKLMAQSGPLKIAFYYNVPVIASDQEGFTEEIFNGVNGYIFKTGDVEDLERVLIHAIETHQETFPKLKEEGAKHIQKKYADSVIIGQYKNMLRQILK